VRISGAIGRMPGNVRCGSRSRRVARRDRRARAR